MEIVELAVLELRYTALESIDYGPEDGQLYGTMEGRLSGERLSGELRLTNLAPRRGALNFPTLRGVLTTDDGAAVWVELDGVATLRSTDRARVFATAFRFRTGAERYRWLNSVLAVLEGVLDSVGVGGVARGRLYTCEPTII